MARKPQVRYFESRNAYYCQVNGKQHCLATGPNDGPTGPTFQAAVKAYGELLSLENADKVGNENTVRVVLEHYMGHLDSSAKIKKSTVGMRNSVFRIFCKRFADTRVSDLTHKDIYAWLEDMKKTRTIEVFSNGKNKHTRNRKVSWSASRQKAAIDAVSAAFNWAIRSGLLEKNPLQNIDKPSYRSRSRDFIVDAETHTLFLAAIPPRLRDLVVCLENTGCRPSELTNATAKDFNAELGAIVYFGENTRKEGETGHKTGKYRDRFIFLDGKALELVKGLVEKYPTGKLFRTKQGKEWTPNAMAGEFKRWRKRLALSNSFVPYAYRHTFCTRWLLSGRSIDILAELVGNSAEVIRRHYSHLLNNPHSLRNALADFRGT